MKIASIILCAGQGTRMKSKTSKMLQQLCGRPLCYWSTKSVLNVSETPPVVVVGHDGTQVQEALENYFPGELRFIRQEQLDGTGGAVKLASEYIDPSCESVLIAYGDTPLLTSESLGKLINIQKRSHVPIGMFSANTDNPSGYGRIIRNSQEHISYIIEEKDASMAEKEVKEINPGIFVFDTAFLRENLKKISNDNKQQEYYLTDIIKLYIKNGPQLGPVESLEVPYEEIHGVNDQKQLAYARKLINRRILDEHMINGVQVLDPLNTYVDDTVFIDYGTTLYPGVHLRGNTKIAKNVTIENGCIVENSTIGEETIIYPYSVVNEADIKENVYLGPFARIRPKTRLDKGCKVGNFVEVKASEIGEGSKVNHLSYVGDAKIAACCNIGAGAITCNYDGTKKSQTHIEKGAFVGSNTTLVAPVTLGKGSYIAAGSTITKDVTEETLAIARSRQEEKTKK